MTQSGTPDLDDVLEAFGSEAAADDVTLAAYVRLYPQFATALADYAHELRLIERHEDAPAPAQDEPWLADSWRRFERAASGARPAAAQISDPFAVVTPGRWAEIRKEFRLPSTVLSGFRDRLVYVASVPDPFLGRLAAAFGAGIDDLKAFLALSPRLNAAASYKADAAPGTADEKITFEALLEQAMVPPERIRNLLDGRD